MKEFKKINTVNGGAAFAAAGFEFKYRDGHPVNAGTADGAEWAKASDELYDGFVDICEDENGDLYAVSPSCDYPKVWQEVSHRLWNNPNSPFVFDGEYEDLDDIVTDMLINGKNPGRLEIDLPEEQQSEPHNLCVIRNGEKLYASFLVSDPEEVMECLIDIANIAADCPAAIVNAMDEDASKRITRDLESVSFAEMIALYMSLAKSDLVAEAN